MRQRNRPASRRLTPEHASPPYGRMQRGPLPSGPWALEVRPHGPRSMHPPSHLRVAPWTACTKLHARASVHVPPREEGGAAPKPIDLGFCTP
ncbi:hypothetical protein E2562_031159 [Oryza meyeriana var. granulata]|uniref:Uncharacterized protein n=1 Tax=Oryza meyeriana var. granulata TaxID=110450 RepID=A0A6G1EBV6_9ORYZ|nr:hypothetical protein E2562_031159 [Oryza meyeriana var. granulata]